MFASLAPARRRLVLGVLGLIVVAALALGVVLLRPSDTPVADVQSEVPGPVVLVPGYGGSTDALDVLAQRLRQAGRDATVVDPAGDATGDLIVQARVLDDAVAAVRTRTGAGSVDVVGYSAGGVVTRLWARNLGGAAQARRIITLGTPNHGAQVAGLAAGLLPDRCPVACQQLAPDSATLAGLNAGDETPDGPQWVSIWSTADQVVTPPSSARLDGALELTVQNVCAGSTVDHGNLPRDETVGAMVVAELGAGPPVALGAADCARLSAS